MTTTQQSSPNQAFSAFLPAVLCVTLAFFVNYTARALIGPLLVYLEPEFQISHAQASGLLFFLSTGFTLSLILSGIVLSYIAPRHMIVISCLCAGCTLLAMGRIETLTTARALCACLGFATGFYFNAAMSTLGNLVPAHFWSRAVSVHELAPAVSFIIAPFIAEWSVAVAGWRGAFTFMGGVSLAIGLFFFFFAKGGYTPAERPSISGVRDMLRSPALWVFAWMIMLGMAGELGPYTVLSLFLTSERGFTPEDANKLLAVSRMASPFAVLISGWVTTRFSTNKVVMFYLVAHAAALCMMAMPHTGVTLLGIFLQPALTAFAFTPIFTLLVEYFPVQKHATILAIAMPAAAYIGSGSVPALLGLSGTYLSFSTGFVLLASVYAVSIVPMLWLSRKTVCL